MIISQLGDSRTILAIEQEAPPKWKVEDAGAGEGFSTRRYGFDVNEGSLEAGVIQVPDEHRRG